MPDLALFPSRITIDGFVYDKQGYNDIGGASIIPRITHPISQASSSAFILMASSPISSTDSNFYLEQGFPGCKIIKSA